MKILISLVAISSCLFAQSQTYWFKFGIEQIEGRLPEISNYYSTDSYSLTNYPTLSFDIKREDEIREFDMSMFSFAMVGLLTKDENGKKFAGYNTTARTDKNLFVVQNRTLLEYSVTKFKTSSFHFGKQFGMNYFGTGATLQKQSLTIVPGVDPGPYLTRINIYGGIHGYFNKDFSNNFSLKIGSSLGVSAGLIAFGAHVSPVTKVAYNWKWVELSADYYYAPTQNAYKSVTTNQPKKSVMPTALRMNFGLAFRFLDK
jgi:hypothetical protein